MKTCTAALALTDAQAGLWFAQRMDPSNPVFNTGQYVEITGPIDVELFRRAVNQAVTEADALAVQIVDTGDEPQQVIDASHRPWLQIIDVADHDDPDTAVTQWIDRDMRTPIDPTRDSLAAEVLFQVGAARHVWYQRVHHLAIDGYGTALLTNRIAALYSSMRTGVTSPAASTPFGSLTAVIDEAQEYRHSPSFDRDRAFWTKELGDRAVVASLAPRVASTAHHYLTEAVPLDAGAAETLRARAMACNVAWPDALTALVAAYVHRHTGGDHVTLGLPSMQRLGTAAARVPAMVMNILPARLAIDETAPLDDALQSVSARLRQLRRHGRYRSEQLRRDLGLLGEQRRLYGPLVNILPFDTPVELAGTDTRLRILGTGPVDDLTIGVRAGAAGDELHIELDANPRVYSRADLVAHGARLAAFVARAAVAERLAGVDTVTPAERQQWVFDVNDTAHPVEDTTLVALIERTIARTPDAPALSWNGDIWTYRQLGETTAPLAAALQARGVGRGDVVAVALPRSRDLVVTLVAILRAGAAYLPLDPAQPADRLERMLASAVPALVVSTRDASASLPAQAPLFLLDEQPAGGDAASAAAPLEPPRPADAAYVIYTSGSTGDPKGVVNEHRGIVNRLEWMREHYGIGPGDRLLQKTPATFDVSVWEFFLAFTSGAMLVVAPPDAHRDPAWLARIIRDERITAVHFVPSMLSIFLAEPAARDLAIARVFVSGEELPAAVRDAFHRVIHGELHNLYGPTEAAVDVTAWPCPAADVSAPIPIGRPVWNTQIYILDGRLRPVPAGVTGDLYIGGIQVARGYLGRPDLTAERFLDNPFGPPGSRMYRTGDLARWREDGAVLFLGRSDHQVKIRGFRIELGDVEHAIMRSGAVRQTAVLAVDGPAGDRRLVAYVVPSGAEGVLDVDTLRRQIEALLPDYMVPAAFVVLPDLPLLSNGKLDRRALPAPVVPGAQSGRPPEPGTERAVARLMAAVLGDDKASLFADDDFFLHGGHSLLGAKLMARLREKYAVDLGLGVLFEHPTPARLARRLDDAIETRDSATAASSEGLDTIIRLSTGGPDRPPLFCIHPAGGISWCYAALARALPDRTVYGIQARGLHEGSALPSSLDEMADDYIREIRQIAPAGPYHLLGWSVGGLVAQAMAVRLHEQGDQAGVVAMLDAYPSDRWRDERDPDERAALKALLLIAGYAETAIGSPDALTRDEVIAFLRQSGHPLGELSTTALEGVLRVVLGNNRLVRRHRHGYYADCVTYFRAALDHQGTTLSPEDWRPYVGALDVHDVPFLHAHLTSRDAVAVIGPIVAEAMARDEETARAR